MRLITAVNWDSRPRSIHDVVCKKVQAWTRVDNKINVYWEYYVPWS